jgi:hypothetical protein
MRLSSWRSWVASRSATEAGRLPNAFPRARLAALGALAAAMIAAACGEKLDGGAACPSLCPQQNVDVHDTIFEAISQDSALSGYPLTGAEPALLVATRGDTLQTAAIIRFDTLPAHFTGGASDSTITQVDSAMLHLHIVKDSSRYSAAVRIDVYDVDTTANDTSTAALRALFRNDRLIGGTTFDTADIKDSLFVALDNAKLLDKITNGKHLRLGIRATSANGVDLYIRSLESASANEISFDPSPDTAIHTIHISPRSNTPVDDPGLRNDLIDFMLTLKAPPTPLSADVVTVGGVSARRIFYRFNVPAQILDSSSVVRATLLLTQRPVRTLEPTRKFTVWPTLVVAGNEVTDLARSALLLAGHGGFDSLRVAPGDSGVLEIEIVTALRTWGLSAASQQQRAIVLQADPERIIPLEAQFFSTRADPSLRPRLRINYALRTRFGIP